MTLTFKYPSVILTALLVLLPIFSGAQTVDSLRNELQSAKDTSLKIELGLELVEELMILEDFPSAAEQIDKVMVLAKAVNDQASIARCYSLKGTIGLQTLTPFDDVALNLLQSFKIYDSIQDSVNASWSLLNLGIVSYSIADYEEAAEYFERCVEFSEYSRPKVKAIGNYLLGLCYSELGKYDKARALLEISLVEYGEGDAERVLFVKAFLGKLLCNEGKYSECAKTLERIIEEYPKQDDKGSLAAVYAFLCAAYWNLGDIDATIASGTYARKNLSMSSGITYWKDASHYLHLALAYKGQYGEAYEVLLDLQRMKDSVGGTQVLERLTTQKAKYEFEEEMFKTKARQELEHQIELRKQNQIKSVWIGSSILALLLAGGFFSRLRYVRKAKNIIEREKNRSEKLLLNILPNEIAEELKDKGEASTRMYNEVSILFTDFKDFTKHSKDMSPDELITELNHCFMAFDHICEKYGIEKIKTLGDSYMSAGGLPVPDDQAVVKVVRAALEMQEFMSVRKSERIANGQIPFEMRAGVHSGKVVAGIVGVKKFQYDVWGDTVNTASRMESYGEVGKVNISEVTYKLIKDDPQFKFEHRGEFEVKGKGKVNMYFVSLHTDSSLN